MGAIDWKRQPYYAKTDTQIAAMLGVSRQAVSNHRPRLADDDSRRQRGDLLCEMVFAHIADRRVKLMSELYEDVVNDYGSVALTLVHRAITKLVEARQIARIGRENIRDKVCGYVRYSSPLLWERHGYHKLQASLEAAFEATLEYNERWADK